jgi:hypothetical protein
VEHRAKSHAKELLEKLQFFHIVASLSFAWEQGQEKEAFGERKGSQQRVCSFFLDTFPSFLLFHVKVFVIVY